MGANTPRFVVGGNEICCGQHGDLLWAVDRFVVGRVVGGWVAEG